MLSATPLRSRPWLPLAGLTLAGAGLAALLLASCGSAPPASGSGAPSLLAEDPEQQRQQPEVKFDEARAFADLVRQVEFGPRVPGTPGHARCKEYIEGILRETADEVDLQDFIFRPEPDRPLTLTNVIGKWNGRDANHRPVILAAHWDTRPIADQDPNPENRDKPIPGANDGASGVAVLLEIARQLKETPPPGPVWLIFFDGEDYGPDLDRMLLGAKHFASRLPTDAPRVGVLLDMIGKKDARFPKEGFSWARARPIVDEVWGVAAARGYASVFPDQVGLQIIDDHIPMLDAGVQMINIIDFDYDYWHTLEDTPDKCSPESLKAVGEVVLAWVLHGPVRR